MPNSGGKACNSGKRSDGGLTSFGSGVRGEGVECRVWFFKVYGLGFWVHGSGFRV